MVAIDKAIEIRSPHDVVWRFLSRLDAMPRWMPGALKTMHVDGLPGNRGARYHNQSEVCGTMVEWDAEITEVKPDERLGWKQASGGFRRYRGSFDLQPKGEATMVRLRLDFELPGVMDVLVTENQALREYNRELDDALLNLKDLLESGRSL